ncbi:copper amine oxidase N-terminal domain-containing protein [Anaerotignum sp.]
MKKIISTVMAAAMVVSLVPATAFAETGEVVADSIKVIGAIEEAEDFGSPEGFITRANAPEVRIKIDEVMPNETASQGIEQELTISIDGAEFCTINGDELVNANAFLANLAFDGEAVGTDGTITLGSGQDAVAVDVAVDDWDETEVTFVITVANTYTSTQIRKALEGAVVTFDLMSVMDNTNEGDVATVSVSGDIIDAELTDVVYAEIVATGLTASVKEVAEVGEEEETTLEEDLKIESEIDKIVDGQVFELKLSKGFEFVEKKLNNTADYTFQNCDENEVELVYTGSDVKSFKVDKLDITIEAVDAKAGDVCELTVRAKDGNVANDFEAKAEAIEVVAVLADSVIVSVDEDEDVPEMWSGVDAINSGLTADADEHESLVVTVEEAVADAWDFKDAFEITLTEGVYVTAVDVTKIENVIAYGDKTEAAIDDTDAEDLFEKAYVDGDQEYFDFGRKIMDAKEGKKAKIEFTLTLVAEPGFEGDVVLTMAGQEVTIATFKAPYVVTAAQNDLVIDYRNTEVPTDIVITEAEAGLWADETEFIFDLDVINFEEDPSVTVNEDESDMEIDDVAGEACAFEVTAESDEEAGVVTISDMELYMSRNLPAGAYDLFMTSTLFDDVEKDANGQDVEIGYINQAVLGANLPKAEAQTMVDLTEALEEIYTDEYYVTAKEAFVNVITAGRDADDASFTKKVVVPVGESYIVAGEETVALDVPAYVSAAGYTMLPVRAVAVALGINTNNVLWDQATKTVTILYGQRIITMTVGSKVINVNGSAIPASATVEVVDGRTFLPMRDLATALGVTDITWDAATKTATLNGNA